MQLIPFRFSTPPFSKSDSLVQNCSEMISVSSRLTPSRSPPPSLLAMAAMAAGGGAAGESSYPFITINADTNKFEVHDEAVRVLQEMQCPVAVVSVAGLYRTGKSYLLNLLKVRSPTLGVFGRVARFARVRPCHRRRRRRRSSTPCFFPHALNRFRGHLLWRPFVPSACSRRPSSVFGSFFLFLIP